jgi:exodeoxyribonuclease VII large subunit
VPGATLLKDLLPQDGAAGAAVLSVGQLARSVRELLERRYPLLWVAGEISNLRPASSGHLYFVLKDEQAQVDCVMFRGRAAHLDWEPRDGLQVEARALVTLYEPRGRFQLNVEAMRRAGVGQLYERFLRLKDKLEREGLFAPEAKRAAPAHPRRIGVVTSLQAAALRDVLTTLARRNPSIPVIVYPVPVQGEGAGEKIARMLALAARRAECDVLLLVRGGGSIEDLWAFNEEAVARAIRACSIPVVVGVGHETDTTIADFAADCRAPTPTAAAELVSPSRAELLERVLQLAARASRDAQRRVQYAMQRIDALARRLVHPAQRMRVSRQLLTQLSARLASAAGRRLDGFGARLALARASLQGLDPGAVLARGYSITRDASGVVLRDAARVRAGEKLTTTLASGWVESQALRKGHDPSR